MKKWVIFVLILAVIGPSALILFEKLGQVEESNSDLHGDLNSVYAFIKTKDFVDLTHAFYPGVPRWKGFPDEEVEIIYDYSDGFRAEVYTHVGQYGTHCDAPAHFCEGLRTIDEIEAKEFICPLCVIDVHEKVEDNPDYVLSLDDIKSWEMRNGKIPEGAFVAMRTDWSMRWPNAMTMENKDENGTAHYPGWSLEVLEYLADKGVTAIGHETVDTDPGIKITQDIYECEYFWLSQDHYQIELMADLYKVPESGALCICTFPKPLNGSGFPARVIAILP